MTELELAISKARAQLDRLESATAALKKSTKLLERVLADNAKMSDERN